MGNALQRAGVCGFTPTALAAAVVMTLVASPPTAAQIDAPRELAAFQARVGKYVEMHQRLEGPLPPLMVTTNMDEVHRLMDALRGRIRAARGAKSTLITPALATVLRQVIGTTLTPEDIVDVAAELAEHTPPGMPGARVNEPLPEDAPFVMIAPQLLRALPPLPPELRYVVLADALILWDHHADLVLEVIPGLFDPRTYSRKRD